MSKAERDVVLLKAAQLRLQISQFSGELELHAPQLAASVELFAVVFQRLVMKALMP